MKKTTVAAVLVIMLTVGLQLSYSGTIFQSEKFQWDDIALNGTATMPNSSTYRIGNGGPFELILPKDGGGTLPTTYSFCIEYNEHIYLPESAKFTIDTYAINGGGGVQPDYIDATTAILYKSFLTNSFGNFVFSATSGFAGQAFDNTNKNHNSALQIAIWNIEGEVAVGAPAATIAAQNLIAWAQGRVAAGANSGGVYALNLRELNGTQLQSQLIWVPEPALILLLGIGLGAVTLLGSRLKR